MAMTSYIKITGKTQGELKGDCEVEGKEDLIVVYSIDHKVDIPINPQSGLPVGQRIHRPFEIVKHKDPSSPLLFQACCTGEHVDTEHNFYRINSEGKEELYYIITLTDAIIVEMQEYNPLNFVVGNEPYKDMESVKFTYSKISWRHEIAGTESEDDFLKPA